MSAALSAVCRKHATESARVFCNCPFFTSLLNSGSLVILAELSLSKQFVINVLNHFHWAWVIILAERSIYSHVRLYRKKRRPYVALLLATGDARR
jgi:hypothetical protein